MPARAGAGRRVVDRVVAGFLLVVETLLCVSLWGPQPIGWLWFGSQVNYWTGSVTAGITSAFLGMVLTLFITLALAKRVDHAWRLVRRAAGYEQKEGALNKIFIIALMIVGTGFLIWFFLIQGPGPSLAPQQ
jgi:hypothetical protein